MATFYPKNEKKVLANTFVMGGFSPRKKIRLATVADYSAIRAIYAPYITETTITFEYAVPSEAEFASRLAQIAQTYPILVCEIEDEIVGYAYAAVFKPRSAYQWTAETVIYLNLERTQQGIGKSLYQALIDVLKLQGICQGIAVITAQNQHSIDFHARLGFVKSATLKHVGYKFGQWIDVDWMQFQFSELPTEPKPILSIIQLTDSELFASLLVEWNSQINL
jgi:phosphinothricin acetyltransferase